MGLRPPTQAYSVAASPVDRAARDGHKTFAD
jgi:hypothetical protein